MVGFLFWLVIIVIMGAWCGDIAVKKGYSHKWAVFNGIVFGFFAVLVYLLLGNKKK